MTFYLYGDFWNSLLNKNVCFPNETTFCVNPHVLNKQREVDTIIKGTNDVLENNYPIPMFLDKTWLLKVSKRWPLIQKLR